MSITCLIPAHNEESVIGDCLIALRQQSVQPDRIIVVTDNCSDKTSYLSKSLSAEVWPSWNNSNKKAGALNQVLEDLVPLLSTDDLIMVVDADSFLDMYFIRNAVIHLDKDKDLAAVGGTFRGRSEGTYVSFCESSEYFTALVIMIEPLCRIRNARRSRGHPRR